MSYACPAERVIDFSGRGGWMSFDEKVKRLDR